MASRRSRITSARRTVVLFGDAEGLQRSILRSALPGDWAVVDAAEHDQADYLVVGQGVVDREVLGGAERLRRVVFLDAENDSLEDEAWRRPGIAVDVVESPSLIGVAEHTVMSMLILFKRIQQASEELRSGKVAGGIRPVLTTQERYAYNWTGLSDWETLFGQPIGLVGVGSIGSRVAKLLNAFGADVQYTKPRQLSADREKDLRIRYAAFDDLLRSSRCVSLHNRFVAETERMMGAPEFAMMPEGSFLVNTARGRLIDEDALADALEAGHLGGAALDVFTMEPLPPESPLLRAPNVLLTPHIAGIPTSDSQAPELRAAARLLILDDSGESRSLRSGREPTDPD